MTAPKNPTITLVYVGLREDTSHKLSAAYLKVPTKDIETDALRLYAANSKGQRLYMMGRIGTTYTVEHSPDNDGSIFSATAERAGMWLHEQDILRWQAESDATAARLKAKAARDKDNRFNAIKEELVHVREVYQHLSYANKPFFLAQVVDYLVR